ncbi:gliding motility-associated C-terminal domain-containing protein [Flavobacterium amniphilum]|uniref:gliding motility-associated C-terminal domain-containing protein n=1 Tax=Flavobacterium amniphilum TaxID=1834035 RepID=UPI00202ABF86|nr:gliding motility-associated C-terminal domain-containing protein [Flavobacterium amniphilum]
MKRTLILFFLILANLSFGQLSDFTLNVTAVNESCPGNGRLNFSVSNTTAGATVVYTVFKLPDVVTPITVTSANSFTGLIAGNYRVVATQSLGAESNSQQQDIVIVSQIVPLTFDLVGQNEVCGNDGMITANVTQGNAVSYEIFSGPVIRPLQASNVFTGLIAGTYQVRVFNACGEGVVRSYVVSLISSGLIITSPNNIEFLSCSETVEHQFFSHSATTDILYPLAVECTVFPPGGATPLVYNQTVNGPNRLNDAFFYSQQMPLYPYQYYTYNIKVTDRCGNIYRNNNIVVDSDITPILVKSDTGCGIFNVTYVWVLGVSIISAPNTFPGILPYSFTPGNLSASATGLPAGNYTFSVTDLCGNVRIENRILGPAELPFFRYFEGCETGMSQIMSFGTSLESAVIISAPATYSNTLPYDVSSNIFNGRFIMTLPGGNYVIRVRDVCGNITTHRISTQGYREVVNFELIRNCNSFDFNFSHSSNYTGGNIYYWLQKRDPSTNTWGHPITGFTYMPNTRPDNLNSMAIRNNSITANIVGTGSYRIVISDDREAQFFCTRVIKKFGYSTDPVINNFYSFACPNGTYEVLVDAEGLGPMTYRITTKNGLAFVLNNGNSPLFSGLAPGIYNFQVEDACGNILNRVFEIGDEIIFPITASELCTGQSGSLSLPNFPFLHYEWWKDNNTTTILSTTNVLQLNPFNVPADFGIYHVRITNPGNPNSCINEVIDYTISPDLLTPDAGDDNSVSYCGKQGMINLYNLLIGDYDTGGHWEETTNSGFLNNNLWDSASALNGVYHFKYIVNGLCGVQDEAQVTIEIKELPMKPDVTFDPVLCENGSLNLHASTVAGATYVWNGPNGFTSALQNPVITNLSNVNNGVYTVFVIKDGCPSEVSSVMVDVKKASEITVSEACENGIKKLYVQSLSNGNGQNLTGFTWTLPDGSTQNGNPLIVTAGNTGAYTVEVLNQEGCPSNLVYNVKCDSCGNIPKGVSANGDNQNDYFDLQCLENFKNVKIFNRYGVLIFEKDNYLNEWGGYDKQGRLLPTATYYYLITFNDESFKSGWVYLNY